MRGSDSRSGSYSPRLQRLTQTGQFDRESLVEAAKAVTQESLGAIYGRRVGRAAYTRLYLFGNYTQSYADELAEMLRLSPCPPVGTMAISGRRYYAPKPGTRLVYQEALPIEDLGMLYLFAAPAATIENLARGWNWSAPIFRVAPLTSCARKSSLVMRPGALLLSLATIRCSGSISKPLSKRR